MDPVTKPSTAAWPSLLHILSSHPPFLALDRVSLQSPRRTQTQHCLTGVHDTIALYGSLHVSQIHFIKICLVDYGPSLIWCWGRRWRLLPGPVCESHLINQQLGGLWGTGGTLKSQASEQGM